MARKIESFMIGQYSPTVRSALTGSDGYDRRVRVAVALTFVVLTCLLTYPQVLSIHTSVPYHTDPYFSMWRLGWVAHAIVNSPSTLFEANIFYPAHDTLAYSDAMLLPGIVLAPFFWAGLNPVAIYNVALLAAFAISGFTMFLLARHLTGNAAAALVAGVIFAFCPYRFSHYMHLELQIVFWIPLALLMIHRIVSSSRVIDGVLLGAGVGFQVLSSIYEGIFLVTFCLVFAPCLVAVTPARQWRSLVMPLIAAVAMTVVLVSPYARPYLRAQKSVGARSTEQIRIYSASLVNYASAPYVNRLYGWSAITDPITADEMNLFPGIVAVALALLGAVGGRGRARFAYLGALTFALLMTAGANGLVYPWLFEHVPPFRGLRSPARFGIFISVSLSALSAYGFQFLLSKIRDTRWKQIAATVIVALLLVEYASAPSIAAAPTPSRIDAQLAQKPPVVIVELPLASTKGLWLSLDFLYMYQGLSHFQRMLNGYSGFPPESYYQMRETMASFPDDRSMAFLRDRHVDYVFVRVGLFEPQEAAEILAQIRRRADLSLEMMWTTGPQGAEALFKVGR
jgi:hypothetical protein